MYLVSVIIPCYNGEKYLENIMSCLKAQTIGFENLEVIMVDHCSQDNSKTLIKQYEAQYENVKGIYLDVNTGFASNSRNNGIRAASSEYVILEDVDDFIMYDSIENLYKFMDETGADFIKSDELAYINEKLYKFGYCVNTLTEYNKDNAVYNHMGSNIVMSSRKFLIENNILFKDVALGDDILFVLDLMLKTNKNYYIIPEPCHIYTYKEETSLTHNVSVGSILSFIDVFDEIMDKSKHFNNQFIIDAYTTNILTFYSFIFTLKNFDKINVLKILRRLNKTQNDYIEYSSNIGGYFKLIHSLILKEKYSVLYILLRIIKIFYSRSIFMKFFRFKNFTDLTPEEFSRYKKYLPKQLG